MALVRIFCVEPQREKMNRKDAVMDFNSTFLGVFKSLGMVWLVCESDVSIPTLKNKISKQKR